MLRRMIALVKSVKTVQQKSMSRSYPSIWINPAELTLLDGHLAHYIPVDALIVVRCDPDELGVRLAERGIF